jgi:hypothetical protein
MPRRETLDGYNFVVGRGEDAEGNTLTGIHFISPDEQHIVEVVLTEEARSDMVGRLTSGVYPVRNLKGVK